MIWGVFNSNRVAAVDSSCACVFRSGKLVFGMDSPVVFDFDREIVDFFFFTRAALARLGLVVDLSIGASLFLDLGLFLVCRVFIVFYL